MPFFDWDEVSNGVLYIWDDGYAIVAEPEDIAYLFLHAIATSTLYHAESTTGEATPISVEYNLVDEAGNFIVDEAGNQIIATNDESAIMFHAKATDTLYHAEG